MITKWQWASLQAWSRWLHAEGDVVFFYTLFWSIGGWLLWMATVLSWDHPPLRDWPGSSSFWLLLVCEVVPILTAVSHILRGVRYVLHLPRIFKALKWLLPYKETNPQTVDLREVKE